jgi:2'-5' RNA ligase
MLHDPIPRHRFFFALLPPILLARQIANGAQWFGPGGHPMRPDRLHITMFILRDFLTVPNGLVDALRKLGDAVRAAPAPVALDLASGGERSIALRPRRKLTGLEVCIDCSRKRGWTRRSPSVTAIASART